MGNLPKILLLSTLVAACFANVINVNFAGMIPSSIAPAEPRKPALTCKTAIIGGGAGGIFAAEVDSNFHRRLLSADL
jgi:hypothetical protein